MEFAPVPRCSVPRCRQPVGRTSSYLWPGPVGICDYHFLEGWAVDVEDFEEAA